MVTEQAFHRRRLPWRPRNQLANTLGALVREHDSGRDDGIGWQAFDLQPGCGRCFELGARARDALRDVATGELAAQPHPRRLERAQYGVAYILIGLDIEAVATRVLVLNRGRLHFDGSPMDLVRRARGRVFETVVADGKLRVG